MLPFVPNTPYGGSNTRSTHRYNAEHIESLELWPEFNVQTIMTQYNNQMGRFMVNDPFPSTPPLPIRREVSISHRLWEYLGPRVRRSLRTGLNPLPAGHATVFWNLGDISPPTDRSNSEPDLTFYTEEPTVVQGTVFPALHNRLPGDVKPSTKWNSAMGHRPGEEEHEYMQVVSQLNYYMHIQKARYGYILTDRELVAFERMPTPTGNYQRAQLRRSDPIPWIPPQQNQNAQYTPTVLMALWYLGMLAARGDWFIQTNDIVEGRPQRGVMSSGRRH